MIICEKAVETVNLYVSVIKFLRYEGIVWQGDSLPLEIAPLGDLYQVSVDLKARGENKRQGDAWWAQHYLHGTFEHGKVYDLEMRVEFCLPVATNVFPADFTSIHPNSYRYIMDFPLKHALGVSLSCQLGEDKIACPIDSIWSRDLTGGQALSMHRERDYCSVAVTAESDDPYSHRHFPVFRFE
ncbi:MAG: hypothetical protein QNK37_17015 [Acidobacteriota bacterium]|nr:hypothetical protein [Acidobacteriota bacterium]